MSHSQILTKEIAEQFVKFEGSVAISEFILIDDFAGRILAKCRSGLILDGLKGLSETAAQALSRHSGGELSLGGLNSISESAAKNLAKYSGIISLNGLTILDLNVARALAKHKGPMLRITGLRSLTDEVAEALKSYKGGLDLSGLEILSESQAQIFEKLHGALLINGVRSLGDSVAIALSKRKGYLSIAGISELSDTAALAFGSHLGGLDLSNLNEVTPAVIKMVGEHAGNLKISSITQKRINDLREYPFAIARVSPMLAIGLIRKNFTNQSVVIIRDDSNLDCIYKRLHQKDFQSFDRVATDANKVDVNQWFKEREHQDPEFWDNVYSGIWPEEEVSPINEISTHLDSEGKALDEVVVVMDSVIEKWMIPIKLRFGGWNNCPEPFEHGAILRYWENKYGAKVVCIDKSTIEVLVERPVATRDEALSLAREQYIYCPEIVNQGYASIETLAASLINSTVWHFWWD